MRIYSETIRGMLCQNRQRDLLAGRLRRESGTCFPDGDPGVEENRVPVFRTLERLLRLEGTLRGRLAASIDRARRGCRRVGRRRRVLPRAPFRPPTQLPV